MSDQDTQTAYFLGLEGEQTGPFSEEELAQKIYQGSISTEALVWWEGQSDWERISDVPKFKALFEPESRPNPAIETPPQSSIRDKNLILEDYTVGGSHPYLDWIATFSQPGKEPMPVYDSKEGYFKHEKIIPVKTAAAALAFCLIGFGGLMIWRFTAPTDSKPVTKKQASPREQELQRRRSLLAQSRSSLLLDPSKSTQQLIDLVNQNAKDEVGKDAAEVLLAYYRQNKMLEQMGDLFMKLERYAEASKAYSGDPAFAAKRETAVFKAFQSSSGKVGADFLLEDIGLLIQPLDNLVLARERVLLFEKTFPGLTHPYNYYLLSLEQKITDLFNRLSSSFVKLLSTHISEEFPQITLSNRPVIEVKRNSSGNMRLVGRYNGDLLIRNDKIKGIFFLYWLVDNQWLLVDTNLTSDRQRFAAATRKKYEGAVLQPNEMLTFLEKQFQKLYPKRGLHEDITSKGDSSQSLSRD